MGIKQHQVQKEYNATPRRISILARHITNHLKARQAMCQAKGYHFQVREMDVVQALEGFVDPKQFKGNL